MNEETSLPALLKLLLSLPDDTPFFATSSFQRWGGSVTGTWPPDPNARGLWLVDTRDRAARHRIQEWKGDLREPAFDAALILGRSRLSLLPHLRRLLRDLRNPGTRRLGETRLERIIAAPCLKRLSFHEHLGVPASFSLAASKDDTGTAFLLTRTPPFLGPIWAEIREALEAEELEVQEFHLRARGAAVVLIVADGSRFIVRLVKNQALRGRVQENHLALLRLREQFTGNDALLRLLPTPVFARDTQDVLLLVETALPGTLAWKVAAGPLGDTIYRESVRFLESLRDATRGEACVDPDAVRNLFDDDFRRVDEAQGVADSMRSLLRAELEQAADELLQQPLVRSTTHGDYGYGNILVDPESGALRGVIDWDTARLCDLPHVDRINLEIQIRRGVDEQSFAEAVRHVWETLKAGELGQDLGRTLGPRAARSVFGVTVARYIIRSFPYPRVFRDEAAHFLEALAWLRGIQTEQE